MLSRARVIVLAALSALAVPAAAVAAPGCSNPNALGMSRTVEIDTSGGPGFGFEQYKAHDFLQNREVVLTFDDGPWPNSTRQILDTLDQHCIKATFFTIGKHAIWHPEIIKDMAARGHTIGTHTWSHANLSKMPPEKAREEIEKGFSAVKLGLGASPASFFRFPFLQDPPAQITYLGQRNVAMFSHDVDSFDFKFRKPEDVVKSVMAKLDKKGKGIILMHDFQAVTAKALPELLSQLKASGYKVVHMRAKGTVTTLAEFDEAARKELKNPASVDQRPTSSVVKTVPTQ